MDTKTGAIAHFEKESDAIRAGFKKLTEADVKHVFPMNRKARRKWAAEQRRAKKP